MRAAAATQGVAHNTRIRKLIKELHASTVVEFDSSASRVSIRVGRSMHGRAGSPAETLPLKHTST